MRFTTASSAAAATIGFDLIISDLGLPGGTELELMAKQRSIHPGVPGIALSGYGMEEDLRRSREAGFVAHLIKPIEFDQLRSAAFFVLSATLMHG